MRQRWRWRRRFLQTILFLCCVCSVEASLVVLFTFRSSYTFLMTPLNRIGFKGVAHHFLTQIQRFFYLNFSQWVIPSPPTLILCYPHYHNIFLRNLQHVHNNDYNEVFLGYIHFSTFMGSGKLAFVGWKKTREKSLETTKKKLRKKNCTKV